MRIALTLIFLLLQTIMLAQNRLSWSTFELLKFEEVYEPKSASWMPVPLWTPELKALDGKEVKITGYIISLDAVSNEYALSAFPFSSCFFCGAAGPESVMELVLEKNAKYQTDDVITFVGKLRLNSDPLLFPISLITARPLE
jgi:hypothetical protein